MKIYKKAKKTFASTSKTTLIIYIVLRLLVILALIRQAMLGNYDNVFLCLLTLVLFLIPYFVNQKLKIELPSTLQIIILIFIFCAEILGEINSYYVSVPHFDTVLHTITGFLSAAVGFALVDLLNNSSFKFKLSPFYLALVAFCFSMTVGVVWELFEYGADLITKSDMQKDYIVNYISTVTLDPKQDNNTVILNNIDKTIIYYNENETKKTITIEGGYIDIGINDTMKDLFVNFIGALVFSVFGALYVKNRDKYKFIENFTPKKIK